MFFIFLNLSFFLNLSWAQPDLMQVQNPDQAAGVVVPPPAQASPVANQKCTKHQVPAGCTCDSSSGLVKINCQCGEVYKKLVYLSNSFIKYSLKRECLIDFFPGCSPVVLPEGANQPCEKLKRIVPKLAPTVLADDFANFCASPLRQKVDLNQGINPLYVICSQGSEMSQAQVFFLP